MDIDKFFNDLNSKSWKNNTGSEVSSLFDALLEELLASKDEIINTTLNGIKILREMKLEDKEELTYSVFKEWLSTRLRENITNRVNEE